MEHQRIHQLLDKYWECATSIEEERELRHFFSSGPIPPELLPFKAWFTSQEAESLLPLGREFDDQVLRHIKRAKQSYRRKAICYGLTFLLLLSAVASLIFWYMPSVFPF